MNEGTTTRILLVDDHPMMRRGLRDLLELEDDLEMVGEAGNGEDAIRLAQQIEPDLILMDLNMPGIDGLETTRRMRDADIDARIIMFTVSDEQSHVLEALRNGADGYLLKDMDAEELIEQIRIAATGRMALSGADPGARRSHPGAPKPTGQVQFSSLTKREKEVLRQIAKGQSNKMIARKLGITEGTVKVHVKNLLHKLGLRSRVEAAVWVLENEAKG